MTTTLRIKDLMERDFAIIAYGATLQAAAQQFDDARADAAVILHDDGSLVGLLSERDLVFAAQAMTEGAPRIAGHYANPKFVIANESEHADDVVAKMMSAGTRRAVIMSDDQLPTGLVSLVRDAAQPGYEPWNDAVLDSQTATHI